MSKPKRTHSGTFKQKISIPILKQPKNVKSLKTKIIAISIISTFILDALSFSLKGAEMAISSGMVPLALVMLFLYFGQRILESTYNTYSNLLSDIAQQATDNEQIQIIMDLCNITRSKVFKKQDNKDTLMENSETIQKSKWYIGAVWNFFWTLPVTISECIVLLGMIIAMIIVEIHDSNSLQTAFIMGLLVICIILYFFLGKKRINLKKEYRKICKDTEAEKDVLFTEIKNIDFISTTDFDYHATKLRDVILRATEVSKKEHLKLNHVFVQRSIIASGFMIAILMFKILTAEAIDYAVIMNVVAVSSVYSTILSKIGSILNSFEKLADTVIDINTLYPDFQNIYDVYVEESSKQFSNEDVATITVNPFCATQDPKKNYILENCAAFALSKGDFALVQGPTGCGKSTLLMLLTGKLRMHNNPIVFSNGSTGYLKSVSYQTDKAVANGFAINEIILDDNPDEKADKPKLLEILHGLSLYPEILRMASSDKDISLANISDDEKVFEFLKVRKIKQFSSGQQQRLALAKLLYTMNSQHQVIALDEAFNRLDDKTASTCIEFVFKFTQKDMQRIVLLATHQVDLVRTICNKEISFAEDLNTSRINIKDI